MSNNVVNFNFKDSNLRTITINNNPYFCVVDLRNILNVPQTSRLIQELTKGFVKSEVLTNGGKQKVYFCNEKDLYKITLRSNSKIAEPFQDWVCGEVLPQLRKTGKYEINPSPNKSLQPQPDNKGFYLYPLTCATSPSALRYKIIDGTIYFKASDIDSILEVSRRDSVSNTRTDTNYTIHHILQDIGITPYSFDYLLNIWQILELCNHIKTKRAELLENILSYKVKPYFERRIKAIQ